MRTQHPTTFQAIGILAGGILGGVVGFNYGVRGAARLLGYDLNKKVS